MTEQQACTLCGAGGHTAAQCNWNDRRLTFTLESLTEALGNVVCLHELGVELIAANVFRQHPEQAEGAKGERNSLRSALEQAYMALMGYLPAHRNSVTDAAIEAARAALSQHEPARQWSDFDDWLVWELESDSNQQFEYPAFAIQLARRAFKCAQLQPASELEQSANFLAEERDIARMIAVGMAHILKAISKNRNAAIPPEVHQSISEVLDIYGVHFPAPPNTSPCLERPTPKNRAAQAVQLPNGYTGWVTQYPGKAAKLWGSREIAELNWWPEDGQRLFRVVEVERIAEPAQGGE
ncbi:hypothetical protein N5J43_16760 [Pseudomonas nicosulfuronedens]|uniref:hypothetical protein n=1 Tax=Pseudomonas nicosulfuronedens TaxID=2571105 RepID=UPI00244778F9|nr:hypothetical protein [Pseudomonas nicosulfuronedens]MDH1012029.1 hypothetical protein [Pseudomonas nicosulfuronedens]MDH1980603.1 hypothetical protein [Pseudomonas nicosulfuronedens]MDH2027553.1 hypothetical protein [Pseudomonas nicosulfuronedens]